MRQSEQPWPLNSWWLWWKIWDAIACERTRAVRHIAKNEAVEEILEKTFLFQLVSLIMQNTCSSASSQDSAVVEFDIGSSSFAMGNEVSTDYLIRAIPKNFMLFERLRSLSSRRLCIQDFPLPDASSSRGVFTASSRRCDERRQSNHQRSFATLFGEFRALMSWFFQSSELFWSPLDQALFRWMFTNRRFTPLCGSIAGTRAC